MFYNLESLLLPLHVIKMQVLLLLALLPYLDFDILKYFKKLKEKDNATFLSHVTFCFSECGFAIPVKYWVLFFVPFSLIVN